MLSFFVKRWKSKKVFEQQIRYQNICFFKILIKVDFLSTRKFIVSGVLFYIVKLRGIRTPLYRNDFMFIGSREGLVVKGLAPLWSGLFSCTLRLIWAEFDFATCFFPSYFL